MKHVSYPQCHGKILNGSACEHYLPPHPLNRQVFEVPPGCAQKSYCKLHGEFCKDLKYLGRDCEMYRTYSVTIKIKTKARLLSGVETPKSIEPILRPLILGYYGVDVPEIEIEYKEIED